MTHNIFTLGCQQHAVSTTYPSTPYKPVPQSKNSRQHHHPNQRTFQSLWVILRGNSPPRWFPLRRRTLPRIHQECNW